MHSSPHHSRLRLTVAAAAALLAVFAFVFAALAGTAEARQDNPWTFPNKQPNTAYFSAYGGDETRVGTTVEPFRTSPLRITYTLPDSFRLGQTTTVKAKFQYVPSIVVGNYCVDVPYGPIGCAFTGTGVNNSYGTTFGSRKISVRAVLSTETNSFVNGETLNYSGSGKRVTVSPGKSSTISFKVKFTRCFAWPTSFTNPVFNDYGSRPATRWPGYACAPASLNIAYNAVVRGAKNAAKWTRGRRGTRVGESTGLFDLVSIKLVP